MKSRLGPLACTLGALSLLLSGCGGNTAGSADSDNSTSIQTGSVDTSGTDSTGVAQGAATFSDGVLTTPEMIIKITSVKTIAPGDEGNAYGDAPVIAFWYEITNLTDGDVSPMNWLYVFSAYQDNNPNAVNELGVGSLPDSRFLESQTEKIKNGGTVENAVAYELDDLTTPVDLVASEDLGMTEIGRMTYNVG